MDIETFRCVLPEFTEAAVYPDAQISFYLGIGEKMLLSSVWGELREQGLALYVAHNLVLARQRTLAANAGGVPGSASGILSSKSVDKVSASYDTQSIALEKGGLWNQTSYGIQFMTLARMVGSLPQQIV